MAVAAIILTGVSALFVRGLMPAFRQAFDRAQAQAAPMRADPKDQVMYDLNLLGMLALASQATDGSFPEDSKALRRAWELNHPRDAYPLDPYDGEPYGYAVEDNRAFVWSSGPDGRSGTDDDIMIDSNDVDF